MIRIALYQPQIPQNTGTLLRTGSCFGLGVDIIRPTGFLLDDKKLVRAGMDYIRSVDCIIHDSFENFLDKYDGKRRLVAMDIGNSPPITFHHDFRYDNNDILIVGSEHYGFLSEDICRIPLKNRVKIPMLPNRRSLNMAVATVVVASEALSQLGVFTRLCD